MINIIKQEITIEESLRQRLEFICEFSHTMLTFINGFIHKVDKTNLSYVEPHKIIIKGTTFLAFNYSNEIYIKNLSQKIKLSELEDYLRDIWLIWQELTLSMFCAIIWNQLRVILYDRKRIFIIFKETIAK